MQRPHTNPRGNKAKDGAPPRTAGWGLQCTVIFLEVFISHSEKMSQGKAVIDFGHSSVNLL